MTHPRLLTRARTLLKSYLTSRAGLKRLGVIRTARSIESDFAEWYVARRLGLRLNPNPVAKGYDALDAHGHRYQIKSRMFRPHTSFHFKTLKREFDVLIGVLLDEQTLRVRRCYKIPFHVVKARAKKNQSNYRFRLSGATVRELKPYEIRVS